MQITYKIVNESLISTPIYLFRLMNRAGAYVELTNWGARLVSVVFAGTNGHLANVLVGYNDITGFLSDSYYMGAIVGRCANRIANAKFNIEGITYHLEANDGRNTNHGGYSGFHQRLWQWEELVDGISFSLFSADGEGGYPGNIQIRVEYRWSEQNELSVTYSGMTDKTTFLNLTNHAYFNLSGEKKSVAEHKLLIPAESILDTTSDFIPTGETVAVVDTPFDFTSGKPIGKDWHIDNEQLRWNRGYNHCYVLKHQKSAECVLAAILKEPETGRRLTVRTDLPGVLLYTAGYYEYPDTAVCLETQYFPDTPSHAHFPSCLLKPEEEYKQQTLFQFDTL